MSNNLDVIFKSYDIRGVFGDTLNLQDAYKIGHSFADFVDSESILIGHDGRLSNMEMLNAVASGVSNSCLLYTSPSPRDVEESRMPSSA